MNKEQKNIIYLAEESCNSDPDTRKRHDVEFFNSLCNDALKIEPIKTKQIIRLGKKNDKQKSNENYP